MGEPGNPSANPSRDGYSSWKSGILAVNTSDNVFYMYTFKVSACQQKTQHEWSNCCYAHPQEKAARRNPRHYCYSSVACTDMLQSGKCPRGSGCHMAHSVFEYWLHPQRYRTSMCRDGANCKRVTCFFAHSELQLCTNTGAPTGDGTDPFAAAKFSLSGHRRAKAKLVASGCQDHHHQQQQLSGQVVGTSLDLNLNGNGSGSSPQPGCLGQQLSGPVVRTSLDLGGVVPLLPGCQASLTGWAPSPAAVRTSLDLVTSSIPPLQGCPGRQLSAPAVKTSLELGGVTSYSPGQQAHQLPGWAAADMQLQEQLSGPVNLVSMARMDAAGNGGSSCSSIDSTCTAMSGLGLSGTSGSLTMTQGAIRGSSSSSSPLVLNSSMASLMGLESSSSGSGGCLGLPLPPLPAAVLPAAAAASTADCSGGSSVARLNDLLQALQVQAISRQQQFAIAQAAADEASKQLQAIYVTLGMPVDAAATAAAAAVAGSNCMPAGGNLGLGGLISDLSDLSCAQVQAALSPVPAAVQLLRSPVLTGFTSNTGLQSPGTFTYASGDVLGSFGQTAPGLSSFCASAAGVSGFGLVVLGSTPAECMLTDHHQQVPLLGSVHVAGPQAQNSSQVVMMMSPPPNGLTQAVGCGVLQQACPTWGA